MITIEFHSLQPHITIGANIRITRSRKYRLIYVACGIDQVRECATIPAAENAVVQMLGPGELVDMGDLANKLELLISQ